MIEVKPEPLTEESFAPFGQVIEPNTAKSFMINEGTTERHHALSRVELDEGSAILSIFRGRSRARPLELKLVERHPLGSQAFVPLQAEPWLVVVASEPKPEAVRCFLAQGNQGVQYSKGVWHHPLLPLVSKQDFLIVDREGPGKNLEEVHWDEGVRILISNI